MAKQSMSPRQQRLTCMVIAILTVASLTVSMLFWENFNLMLTSSEIDLDQQRLMIEQIEPAKISHPKRARKPKQSKQPKTADTDHDQSNNNNNNMDGEHVNLAALPQQSSNTDPIMEHNPLSHPLCQNALIHKERLNKDGILAVHLPKIGQCPIQKRHRREQQPKQHNDNSAQNEHALSTPDWVPFIWTREFIAAITSDRCFEPRTPVRTSKHFFSSNAFQRMDNEIPVFYHIPKCASSSTASMTSQLFNWSIHWKLGPEKMHETIHTQCGFAWIRDPIQRTISAYYTINKKIYREMQHAFVAENIPERFRNRLSFLTVTGEPQRFEAFLDDLFAAPDWWGVEDPLKHTSSQTYFLSNWYGSDINFFGRVEHFHEHWRALMDYPKCKWFKQYYADRPDVDVTQTEVEHALFHYGTMGVSLYNTRDDRSKEYIDALGMRDVLEKMYGADRHKYNISEDDVLPPAYYFIAESEALYNRIADFYYQDFVCFGYQADFQQFQNYVARKKNPFLMH